MENRKVYTAIGLMSGTSLDGIDAVLVETDGYHFVRPLGFVSQRYNEELRNAIRAVLGKRELDVGVSKVENSVTLAHINSVKNILIDTKRTAFDVDVIGFHGQTLFHDPANAVTVQVGDGALMARETAIDVVNKIRNEDVAAGGQGAPLLPLYHRARVMAEDFPRPVAVLNIGGVGNVTWIGEGEDEILAFDTGPGNALLDDFIKMRTGQDFDESGEIARTGEVDQKLLERWMKLPYFERPVPKSLDRDEWGLVVEDVQALSTEDGAATLASFTVETIRCAVEHFSKSPELWLVTGGGRHNQYIMHGLRNHLRTPVKSVDDYGWDGDAMEAEGFAYLAVRSLLGEPLSLPSTTGVPAPQTGGTLHKAP